MNKIMRFGLYSLALGSLAYAHGALAAGILGQVNVGTDAQVDTGIISATSSVKASAGATSSTGPSNGSTGSSSGSASGDSNGSIGVDISASGSAASSSRGEVTVVTRGDAESSDASAITDPMEVSTGGDFEAYAKSVIVSDENIAKIESGADAVSIWYKEPAKFIGVFPVMVSAKITVAADGKVEVSHPWWTGIFVTGEDSLNIESDLDATAGTIARSSGSATFSSNTQARLVNALRAVLQTHASASSDVDASAEASTN